MSSAPDYRICPVSIPLEEGAKSLTSMTIVGFLLCGQLGKGLALAGKVEQRIIAKSLAAPGHSQQLSPNLAVKDPQDRSALGGGDHADKLAPPVFLRQAFKLMHQNAVVVFI